MMARPAYLSVRLTCVKGEQLYLRIVRPLGKSLRPRAQTASTENFSTARNSRNSHDFHKPGNTREDHNGGNSEDDDDDNDVDDDDDVSSDFFAVHP